MTPSDNAADSQDAGELLHAERQFRTLYAEGDLNFRPPGPQRPHAARPPSP